MKIPQEFENLSKRDLIRLILNQQLRIEELEKRLLAYENSNTPPSKSNNRKYPEREPSKNPIGAPKKHEGKTRPYKEPDKIIDVKQEKCNRCKHVLGEPIKINKRIIEDIPKPQPVIITQYNIHSYLCPWCAEINIAKADIPAKGRFGYNLIAQITLMKYEDRLPLRKIARALNRQHNLDLTPAAVLDILERAADYCELTYEQIKVEIQKARNVNSDETGNKVNGRNWWTWIFTTTNLVLFLITKSRGQKAIIEILGKDFLGILNCDGWTSYPKIIKRIQRCWAHLLREAKWYSEKYEGKSKSVYSGLCKIFNRLNKITESTINGIRRRTYNYCTEQMGGLIKVCKRNTELRKFAVKLENGFQYWFTCIFNPYVEPTNNRAERGLREMVIQRKIMGTLRNERGTRIMQILMSVIGTWNLQGLNTYEMLLRTLGS